MKRLSLFTIGSVQEYIMESKKVIDLVNSSLMISNLMIGLNKYIEDEVKGEILLPYIEKYNADLNISNQILISYESDSSRAYEFEKYCLRELENLLQRGEFNTNTDKEELHNQLKDMLSIYWVEIPIYNEEEYEEKYKKLCSYLEAVKCTNKFTNTSNEDYIKGEKCSTCGKRNVLFKKKDDKRIKNKEELCGVCYLKRIYNYAKVDSTAQIALGKWIEKNKDRKEYKKLEEMAKEISKASEHGKYQLLYEENMINEIKKSPQNYIENVDEEELKGLYEKLSENQEKYYCIYRLDIDNLGKWISGQYRKHNENLKEYQKELSKNIHIFLTKIASFFKNKENSVLVYAGGDDVLALLNVEDAFELSIEINNYFSKTFDGSLFKNISFSQGIFIVHYKDTLRESLKLTKERLDAIKDKFKKLSYRDEKNALIISVLTDGYFYKEFYFKNYFKEKYIVEEINKLIGYFREKSSFFHNELSRKFENMDFDYKNDLDIQDDIKNMLIVEQRKYLKRSNRNNKLDNNIEKLLIDILNNNRFEMDLLDIKNYLNMFYIIEKIKSLLEGDESV